MEDKETVCQQSTRYVETTLRQRRHISARAGPARHDNRVATLRPPSHLPFTIRFATRPVACSQDIADDESELTAKGARGGWEEIPDIK